MTETKPQTAGDQSQAQRQAQKQADADKPQIMKGERPEGSEAERVTFTAPDGSEQEGDVIRRSVKVLADNGQTYDLDADAVK